MGNLQQRARQARRAEVRRLEKVRRRKRELVVLLVGVSAAISGIVGIAVRGTNDSGDALRASIEAAGGPKGSYTEQRDWRYTYVATDVDGVTVVGAAGVLRYRYGSCTNSGQVQVGALPVNPGSPADDVRSSLALVSSNGGVGRIVSDVDGERVILRDWSETTALPLVWLEPLGAENDLCGQFRAMLGEITSVAQHAGSGGVEQAIATDDASSGTVRLVGTWRGGSGMTRPEIEVGQEQLAFVVRSIKDGSASILMASLRLSAVSEDDGDVR